MGRVNIRRALAIAALCLTATAVTPAGAAPAPVTITFDDDRAPNTSITCNTTAECAPSHHAWLRAKGIDVLGTPSGKVWTSRLEGVLSTNRVGLGYASPDFSDRDGGIDGNEVLAIRFLNAYAQRIELELTVLPTNNVLVNSVASRVLVQGLNERCEVVAQSNQRFTGVTNGRLTPTRVTVTAPRMGTVLVQVGEHPFGGVFVQAIKATPLEGTPPSESAACDPSMPVTAPAPTARATATARASATARVSATPRAIATHRASATPRRTATSRVTVTARPTLTPGATATPRQPSAGGAACLNPLAEPVQATREINEAVADLSGAIDCLVEKGDAPNAWRGDLFVRFNGVQRHLSRADHRSTDRMLRNTVDFLGRLGRKESGYAVVAGQLQSATDRLAKRVAEPDRAGI